jgi:hypothetical protein
MVGVCSTTEINNEVMKNVGVKKSRQETACEIWV